MSKSQNICNVLALLFILPLLSYVNQVFTFPWGLGRAVWKGTQSFFWAQTPCPAEQNRTRARRAKAAPTAASWCCWAAPYWIGPPYASVILIKNLFLRWSVVHWPDFFRRWGGCSNLVWIPRVNSWLYLELKLGVNTGFWLGFDSATYVDGHFPGF